MKLIHSETVHLEKPYNFDYSTYNPTHYPTPTGDWEKGKLWFTMKFENQKIGIRLTNQGTIDKPVIQISIYADRPLNYKKLIQELSYCFEWDRDYSDFYKKFDKDNLLAPVLKKFRGMHGFCAENLYDYIMISIFLQNTTAKRTAQMTKTMLESYGTLLEFDNRKLWCFWTPEELVNIPEQELRDLKVGYRAKSFLRVSKDFVDGVVNERQLRTLPVDDLRAELLKIYGIGPASVMYILNDVFHHKVLDVIMPWEGKLYSRMLFNKDGVSPQDSMTELKKRYGDWRGLAVHFLFMNLAWQHKKKRIDWMEKLLPFV